MLQVSGTEFLNLGIRERRSGKKGCRKGETDLDGEVQRKREGGTSYVALSWIDPSCED